MIASPCIRKCNLDPKTKRCTGCGRTQKHLKEWLDYTEEKRYTIIKELEELASIQRKSKE